MIDYENPNDSHHYIYYPLFKLLPYFKYKRFIGKTCTYQFVLQVRPIGNSYIRESLPQFPNQTRTHWMAGHRKSPRTRRNLMVIDPLTPSKSHQFDHRVKFFSVSRSTAHPLKFDMPHDHVQKIKDPSGGGPKNCAGACAIHVNNSHTKSG